MIEDTANGVRMREETWFCKERNRSEGKGLMRGEALRRATGGVWEEEEDGRASGWEGGRGCRS
jgi:hypothetical protein